MKELATNKFRVKVFKKLMAFATAFQNLSAKTTPPPFRLMQIGSLFWQSRVLYVATKLGLAEIIGNGKKSTEEIAKALNLHEDHLYRLMRMLASMGIFYETMPRVFRNSKTSNFLRADNPKNVRAMILMHNSPEMTKPWMEPLEQSMHDGAVPFEKIHGMDLFSYMDQNKDFDVLFSAAMDAVENLTGDIFLQDFNWGAFDRIIDIGGSKGSKSVSILKLFPKLKALVFDRAQIIEEANTFWNGKIDDQVLARIDFQSGNMFERLPVSISDNDLYVFFAIFHGLNDEQSKQVLGNLKTATGTNKPYLLIADNVADDIHASSTLAAFDMQMLIGTRGRERTLGEWKQLLNDCGFEMTEVIDIRMFAHFIIARPSVKA